MRVALLILLVALAGCSTIRETFGGGDRKAAEAATPDTPREVLPGGLVGDKANAAYTAPPPQD